MYTNAANAHVIFNQLELWILRELTQSTISTMPEHEYMKLIETTYNTALDTNMRLVELTFHAKPDTHHTNTLPHLTMAKFTQIITTEKQKNPSIPITQVVRLVAKHYIFKFSAQDFLHDEPKFDVKHTHILINDAFFKRLNYAQMRTQTLACTRILLPPTINNLSKYEHKFTHGYTYVHEYVVTTNMRDFIIQYAQIQNDERSLETIVDNITNALKTIQGVTHATILCKRKYPSYHTEIRRLHFLQGICINCMCTVDLPATLAKFMLTPSACLTFEHELPNHSPPSFNEIKTHMVLNNDQKLTQKHEMDLHARVRAHVYMIRTPVTFQQQPHSMLRAQMSRYQADINLLSEELETSILTREYAEPRMLDMERIISFTNTYTEDLSDNRELEDDIIELREYAQRLLAQLRAQHPPQNVALTFENTPLTTHAQRTRSPTPSLSESFHPIHITRSTNDFVVHILSPKAVTLLRTIPMFTEQETLVYENHQTRESFEYITQEAYTNIITVLTMTKNENRAAFLAEQTENRITMFSQLSQFAPDWNEEPARLHAGQQPSRSEPAQERYLSDYSPIQPSATMPPQQTQAADVEWKAPRLTGLNTPAPIYFTSQQLSQIVEALGQQIQGHLQSSQMHEVSSEPPSPVSPVHVPAVIHKTSTKSIVDDMIYFVTHKLDSQNKHLALSDAPWKVHAELLTHRHITQQAFNARFALDSNRAWIDQHSKVDYRTYMLDEHGSYTTKDPYPL
jgi:hypothetical protein